VTGRIILPHNWTPKPHQLGVLRYMEGGGKRAVCVWHRRGGKDTTAANWTSIAAMKRVGTYWHMLPTLRQARLTVWDGINGDGTRIIDQVWPEPLRQKIRHDEMKIELVNGSVWQLVGSDNYDSLVGSNPVGVVFSEWSLTDPRAWDFVRPILAQNGGWAMFIYTPRGKNHGWELLEMARANPDWFTEVLDCHKTNFISDTVIEMERRSGMSPELIAQEYFCSFEAPNTGSYYGRAIEELGKEGRITKVPYDPNIGVHTWWDLGVNDPTAIWFTQSSHFEHRVIDYYEGSGEGIAHYVKVLNSKPYAYAKDGHHFPHDIKVREFSSGKSRVDTLAEFGITAQIGANLPVEDGIEAARGILPLCWFDAEKCAYGLKALTSYHRKWDEKKRSFATHPEHDWACLEGNTKLLTRYGMRRIMDLPETGEVMTQCGWKRYWNPHVTRRNAPLVEVRLSDGSSVKCTPEHRWLTDSGWKFASDLLKGMPIQSYWTLSRSTSMAASIGFGRDKAITQTAEAPSIGPCGPGLLVQSQPDVIFITATGVRRITGSIISNVSQLMNTFQVRGMRQSASESSTSRSARAKRLLNGMLRRLGVYGTGGMRNESNRGRSGSASHAPANIAAILSIASCAKAAIRSAFVAIRAKPLRIESVERLHQSADVWCLTVPDAGQFALASGAIVHNSHASDAWREFAVGSDKTRSIPYPERRPRSRSWMAA
jgi:phage terminase large subunit